MDRKGVWRGSIRLLSCGDERRGLLVLGFGFYCNVGVCISVVVY